MISLPTPMKFPKLHPYKETEKTEAFISHFKDLANGTALVNTSKYFIFRTYLKVNQPRFSAASTNTLNLVTQ